MKSLIRNAIARLPVPDTNGLIIRGAHNPRILVVKERCSNVIQMTEQREKTLSLLIVPDFDFVVVTTRHKQWLLTMKRYTTNRPYEFFFVCKFYIFAWFILKQYQWTESLCVQTIVFVEFVYHCGHSIVPELDDATMQWGEHPGPLRMKGQTLHSGWLRFELD